MTNHTRTDAPAAGMQLLTTSEAARMLGVAPATLATWRCRGTHRLPFVTIGNMIRYERAEVEKFIANHRTDPITGARYGVGRAWLEGRNNARYVLRALVDAFHSHGHDIEVATPSRVVLPDGKEIALDSEGYLCVPDGDYFLPLIGAHNALNYVERVYRDWEAAQRY